MEIPPIGRPRGWDEEECRDFVIHELGSQIPSYYDYSKGIHLVYQRLLSRYGDDVDFARALGVFEAILEHADDSDGQVWSSWKHSHKIRRDNFCDPLTPHFANMILPAPIRPTFYTRHTTPNALNEGQISGQAARSGASINSSARSPSTPQSPKSPNQTTPEEYGDRQRDYSTSKSIRLESDPKHPSNLRKFISRGITAVSRKRPLSPPPVPPKDRYSEQASSPGYPRNAPFAQFDGPAEDLYDVKFSPSKRRLIIQASKSQGCETCGTPSSASPQSSAARCEHPPASESSASSRSNQGHYTTSKDSFRQIVQHNLHGTDGMSEEVTYSPLDPAKYSPPSRKEIKPQPSQQTYTNIANSNPFADDQYIVQPHETEKDDSFPSPTPYNTPLKDEDTPRSQSDNQLLVPEPLVPRKAERLHGLTKDPLEITKAVREGSSTPSRGRRQVTYVDMSEKSEKKVDPGSAARKRSRSPMKKLFFGESKALGRSLSMKTLDESTDQYRKMGIKQWGEKLKQRVEDLTEDVSKLLPTSRSAESKQSASKFPISLDPPTQAKLYMEMELMLCVTANSYLMQQRKEGRMSVDSIAKITEFWRNKGRPQVVEFQFDQATQRDLVLANLKNFRFYGQHSEDVMHLHSMLRNWRDLAKEMSVRTFCQPDAVVRRHMHDIYRVLELLGAPLSTFLAFQDLQVAALETMRNEQKRKEDKKNVEYGVERVWHPPGLEKDTKENDGKGKSDSWLDGSGI